MSRNTKIIFGIVLGSLALCCVGAVVAFTILPRVATNFFEESFIEDPEEAAAIAQSIVDYELPPGFVEEGAMEFFGINMVFFRPESIRENAYIMMMEFPASLAGNEAEMRRQMEETFSQQTGQSNLNMTYEGSEEVTINGAPATLAIYEGTDENGVTMRQASAIFQTKSETPGMLMIFGAVNEWESMGMERFLRSLE